MFYTRNPYKDERTPLYLALGTIGLVVLGLVACVVSLAG